MEAILLLGHGCRLTSANKVLKEMAQMVMEMGDISLVEIAFLQFERKRRSNLKDFILPSLWL